MQSQAFASVVMAQNSPTYVQLLGSLANVLEHSHWQPAVDIYRTQLGWLVKFELAGVRPEDIEVSAVGRILKVRGFRYDWAMEQSAHSYSMEIAYNRFERKLQLPCHVDPAAITSEYRDGMLLLRIPEATGEQER